MRDVEIQKKSHLTVYVDADACPVKTEVQQVCEPYDVNIKFVAAYTNTTNRYPDVSWVWVEPGRDSADFYILNHVKSGDIVVTEDLGLAAGCLAKAAYVVTSRGKEIKDSEIDLFLETRHLHAKARRSGKYEKGPKKIKMIDKSAFTETMKKILSKIEGF
ncbi:YaiI/YqxD family protein [Pradoshia sp.]|uniref:YaiI/YqxD family protein n=1 Tax=Pradoshia sp. TaxID=2651281 RepID=UPI003F082481